MVIRTRRVTLGAGNALVNCLLGHPFAQLRSSSRGQSIRSLLPEQHVVIHSTRGWLEPILWVRLHAVNCAWFIGLFRRGEFPQLRGRQCPASSRFEPLGARRCLRLVSQGLSRLRSQRMCQSARQSAISTVFGPGIGTHPSKLGRRALLLMLESFQHRCGA